MNWSWLWANWFRSVISSQARSRRKAPALPQFMVRWFPDSTSDPRSAVSRTWMPCCPDWECRPASEQLQLSRRGSLAQALQSLEHLLGAQSAHHEIEQHPLLDHAVACTHLVENGVEVDALRRRRIAGGVGGNGQTRAHVCQALNQFVVELQRLDRRLHRGAHAGGEVFELRLAGRETLELLQIGRDRRQAVSDLVDLGVALAHGGVQLRHAEIQELMQASCDIQGAGPGITVIAERVHG